LAVGGERVIVTLALPLTLPSVAVTLKLPGVVPAM
jgi:hypothetical protein